jgi:hypothetical protein
VRKVMYFRSITTLCLFAAAAVVALKYPLVGLGICISCLIVYLNPILRKRSIEDLVPLRGEAAHLAQRTRPLGPPQVLVFITVRMRFASR